MGTPTRAYQKVLGNIFNEQVRHNPHIPVSQMVRHPTTQVATSNPGTQGQPGILQGQHMGPPHVPHTSPLQHNPVPTIAVPSVPIPRATNTSTVNTLLGGPRMSLGVTTAPTLQQKIGNMEYEYNSNSFISSSLSNPSNRSTNPFLNGSMQAHSSIAIPVTIQNTLPHTLPTQTVTQTNVTTTNPHPQLPNLEKLYEDRDGNPNYYAMYIGATAKLQAYMELAKPNTHKINYGRVPPPILTLDNELRSTTYQLWKASWLDFVDKAKMHDFEGLTFLKEQSINNKGLKNLKAVCESVQAAFELLDTQFGDKEAELRLIKSQICDHPMLSDNYDFEYQISVVQKILQYVTIFNRLFLPQGEDFHAFELNNSMMSWIPKAQQMTLQNMYEKFMTYQLEQEGIPRSKTYRTILTENIRKLATLKAGDDSKKRLAGILPFQTLNIMDQTKEVVDSKDITETQICYGPSKNSPKPGNNNMSNQQNNQQPVKILKREPDVKQTKENNSDVKCMLCNDSHATHRCPLTRQLRDGQIKAPPNFCWSHCGRVYDLCNKKQCFIVSTRKLKKLNLTCGKPNHGNRHFLLCPIEGCRKGAEKFWQKQKENKVVHNLIPVEDVDLENEIIDIDYDDFDEKLEVSDNIALNQLFIPTLAIKNDDNQVANFNFAKTFFRLEKVNVLVPNSNETTPVIILFDCGSGKTVGNDIEHLDGFENPHYTDIILSSLNGIDRTQKRVCELTIVGTSGEQFPIEVIIPADLIPKPPIQNMDCFKK